MLRQMRERTKTILWIVVITFVISIFALWGMDLRSGRGSDMQDGTGPEIVGTVDGEDIDARQYAMKIQELTAQVRSQRGENYEFGAAEEYMIREQAWEMAIEGILISREITKLGISVTDDELVAYLRRNPHPQLRQMFTKENGDFDYQAYLQALSDPNNDWTELEKWGRSELPTAKLTTYLLSQIHIADRDLLEKFRELNIEMTAEYARIPFEQEDQSYQPSDEELRRIYEKDKDNFTELEKRRIQMLEIKKAPTAQDEKEVLDELNEIRREIMDGMDFAEAAKSYSDDYMTAANGGDLGFFSKDMMDSTFTDAAFTLERDEMSRPVRTPYGFHLIKLTDRKTEDGVDKVSARHILLKVEPGYDTMDSLSTFIISLREKIHDEGFEKAASESGLEIIDLEPFNRGAFIKDYGYVPQIVNFAFGHEPGTVSSDMHTDDSAFFIKIVESIPERLKTIDEVRDVLVETARRERGIELSKRIAEQIREQALTGGDLEGAAHSKGLEVKKTPPFKYGDAIPEIGTGTAFAYACKILPVSTISAPVEGSAEWYVIRLVSRSAPDMNEFAKQRDEIRNQILQEQSTQFLGKWYQQLRDKAEVVDNRDLTLK